jgi:hypothetical protein
MDRARLARAGLPLLTTLTALLIIVQRLYSLPETQKQPVAGNLQLNN